MMSAEGGKFNFNQVGVVPSRAIIRTMLGMAIITFIN